MKYDVSVYRRADHAPSDSRITDQKDRLILTDDPSDTEGADLVLIRREIFEREFLHAVPVGGGRHWTPGGNYIEGDGRFHSQVNQYPIPVFDRWEAPPEKSNPTGEEGRAVMSLSTDPNDVIKTIRKALKERSGKEWSVSRGKGTACGWLHLTAPPSRRVHSHDLLPEQERKAWLEDAEEMCRALGRRFEPRKDTLSPEDREELSRLLGIEVNAHGVRISPEVDSYRLYMCRALYGVDGGFREPVDPGR